MTRHISSTEFPEVKNKVDTNNTTFVTLAADTGGIDHIFTGVASPVVDFVEARVNVYSDVASATDGLSIQYSADGISWRHTDPYTVPADNGKNYQVQRVASWYRIVYTNGTTIQTVFELQTLLNSTHSQSSSHRIQDSISSDDDGVLVKAVGTGEDDNGIFRNIKVTEDGAQAISDESSGLAIAKGDVTGTTFVHKFGNAPDFDTTDNEVTVWDGADDGTTWELMNYVYSAVADIDSVSSSDAADTNTLIVEGLDTNWDLVEQEVTLTGQARVALPTPLIRVFRAFNNNGVAFVGHVIIYVNGAITAGVPDVPADIRAVIQPEEQQTLMAVYSIPAGKTGYLRDFYIATSGGSKSSNYVFKVKSREFGGVFRTKHITALEALSPIPYQHSYTEPEIFTEKTDIEMRVQSLATPVASENAVSAGFDIVLVDN